MRKLTRTILAAVLSLLAAAPSYAVVGTTHFKSNLDTTGNLNVAGSFTVTGAQTFTGNTTVGGNLAVTGTTTATGVITGNAANILQHANTGLKVLDTGADHTVSIVPSSDEAANRTLSLPALGGAQTLAILGAQTFTGVQTFTLSPVLSTATITASGDIYTIPDVGAANFIMSAGSQTIAGATTFTLAPVLTSATISANGDTITIQDLGNANIVQTEGTQTINGTKTFGTAPTITGGLTAANIQTGSAKRQTLFARLSPETGVAADTTVYRAMICPGRAGSVKRVTYVTHVDPVSGTNVITIQKAAFGGTTMLSTANVSLNGATADTAVQATLTGTGADLAVTAAQCVCAEYNAGTQGTDAEQVSVSVEFEPDDF